ncbi:AAA family ATPase [Streptomyces fradiae]|uniref:AAA family ATPase n=1 Tax=Streptomyces fradiae TaxID=1906 RepID=UPI0029428A9C|nr:AAA family ATPase [Streptomyces fradiae]WOI61847.1 AAA family ATPase [Streptomyces fradiae]
MSTVPFTEPTAPDLCRLFRDRLRHELRPPAGPPPAVPDARGGYRRAACLLTSFDPRRLRLPGEAEPTGRAVMELAADCAATGPADRTEWTLKPEVREAALRSLPGPEAALRALEANVDAAPEEPGPERVCLAVLRGEAPRTAGAGPDELSDVLQAVLWLSSVPGVTGLPDAGAVRAALEQARLLAPLERLVRVPFVGREAELAALRDHVDAPGPPPGAPPSVPSPLVVHGPGGMGKSTLLATFLLDGLREPGGAGDLAGDEGGGARDGGGAREAGGGARAFPFPFAYIDFERPTLSVYEPVTLIAEVARQLGVQYPAFRAELDALAAACLEEARAQRAEEERVVELNRLATTRANLGRRSSLRFLTDASERESALSGRVGEVLCRAAPEGAPFVMVVDSFEEAQYRGSPALGRMWAVFAALSRTYPRVRAIVSGRSPVGHPAQRARAVEVELHDLDQEAAVALLRASGVADPEVARTLADRVGGHPLSLRLAARAALLAGADTAGLRELIGSLPARRRDFFRRVDQLLVQGILYERILQHIPDQDVRRLAQAGLVLRLITPDVVREVLAEPCGVAVPGPREARSLFGRLSRLDLVEPAGPEAVRVRADVRAIMLRLAEGDPRSPTREVERRAVEFYAAREGLEARAEEIYHRLRRGEHPRTVEERWLPGVERLLAGAQDEMGPRAAALLSAHRRRGGASELVMAEADQEDWERIAAHEVEDLLAQGLTGEALVRLAERRPWTPCSPLHVLLAEALDRAGRTGEARRAASDAVDGAREAGCGERQLELLLLAARLAEQGGDIDSAYRDLRLAEDVAIGLGQDLEAMGTLLARARLAAAGDTPDRDADSRLARRLRQVPDEVLADQPSLVRAAASQVYTLDARALDHALDLVGLPEGDEVLERLAGGLRRAARADPLLLRPLMDLLRSAAGVHEAPATGAPLAGGAAAGGGASAGDAAGGTAAGGAAGVPAAGGGAPGGPAAAGDAAGGGAAAAGAEPAGGPAVPAPPPSDVADILRLVRDRGALDTLVRRLLVLHDESGEIATSVAAALRGDREGGGPR